MMLFSDRMVNKSGLFIFVLLFFSYCYYQDMLFMYPNGIHSGAQADRLSLAICFYDNGMNFFLPATHNQYSVQGITGVEFPIQSYIAAALGHIFGRANISICFRAIDILISLSGLTFLFLACYRATKDFIISLLPALFLFYSPVYIYYTCNYLPDPAATSISFIGFYFVLEYVQRQCNKSLILATVFLTLAGLIKTSVAICLLGFAGYVLFERLANRKHFTRKDNGLFAGTMLLALAFLLFYYFYNRYLNEKYHSWIFLAEAKPFKNWASMQEYYNVSFLKVWGTEYLLLPQYFLAGVVLLAGLWLLPKTATGKKHFFIWWLYAAGCTAIFYLLGEQMHAHDYYITSVTFPFLAFALLVSTIAIQNRLQKTNLLVPARVLTLALTAILFVLAYKHQKRRLHPTYMPDSYREMWMDGGARMLDSLNIPKDELIGALNEDAPITALVYFDRKGYNLPYVSWENSPFRLKDNMKKLNIRIFVCDSLTADYIESPESKESFYRFFVQKGRYKQLAVYALNERY